MSSEKKPPSTPAKIEADLTRDLRKVGGFFKDLFHVTQRIERGVKEATREEREEVLEEPPRPIARIGKVEVLPKCEVCGDKREVGESKKIPCPACSKLR